METATQSSSSNEGASAPTIAGWVMILLGVGLIGWAYFVGLGTDAASVDHLIDGVELLERSGRRSMMLLIGATVFVSGWVALGSGLIIDAIKGR